MRTLHHVVITPHRVVVDEEQIVVASSGKMMLKEIYQSKIGNYPKFYKMDMLCKLGFVASELLLQKEGDRNIGVKGVVEEENQRDDRAVILLNSSSSICDDSAYQKTIEHVDDYFPSPMIFVYTLANIVTGEIALRNRYYGETNFYVIPQKDEKMMMQIVEDSFMDEHTTSAICGWLNCDDEEHFEADLYLVEK